MPGSCGAEQKVNPLIILDLGPLSTAGPSIFRASGMKVYVSCFSIYLLLFSFSSKHSRAGRNHDKSQRLSMGCVIPPPTVQSNSVVGTVSTSWMQGTDLSWRHTQPGTPQHLLLRLQLGAHTITLCFFMALRVYFAFLPGLCHPLGVRKHRN